MIRTTTNTRHAMAFITTLVIACAAWTTPLSAKRTDDHLVMDNGDRLVGEIKKLEHGELQFKPGYVVDSFYVDWNKVREIDSQDQFQVLLHDGRHLTGLIAKTAGGQFTITTAVGAPVSVSSSEVVGFLPVETSIWHQLTGNINSGFNYSNDDNQTTFSASGELGYVADHWSMNLSGSSTSSGQSEGSSTTRNTTDLNTQYTFRPNWFSIGILGLLNSHQQQLNLRTTVGGGIGRWLIQSATIRLAVFGGAVYTHEQYASSPDPSQPEQSQSNNLEGLLAARFALYRFKTTDVEANVAVYPSFSTPGRVRVNAAPSLNIEIAHNLYWTFSLYENYDSQPPVSANKNDFGVTNSLGWKF